MAKWLWTTHMYVCLCLFPLWFSCTWENKCSLPQPYTMHCLLSVTGAVVGVLHFSALYCVSLSIAIWSKQHCVSCAGTGAWLFRCSLYRRHSQSERPARAGLSCECSGRSEYNSTESVLKVVYFIRRVYTGFRLLHLYRMHSNSVMCLDPPHSVCYPCANVHTVLQ